MGRNTFLRRIVGIYMVACVLFTTSLHANSLLWDSAGGNGQLDVLSLSNPDSPSDPASYLYDYRHYEKDGFLGRFVYQGEADVLLTFMQSEPFATGSGASVNYFYYTKDNDTRRWRRVFLVATVKALLHNGSERSGQLVEPNVIIDNPGDSLLIPAGAGSEMVDPSASDYSGGYDAAGIFGNGPSYIYRFPYAYIWIDLTVIRTNSASGINNPGRGGYGMNLRIAGNGIAMNLSLTGNHARPAEEGVSYSFELDRTCPEVIPFNELVVKNTFDDSYQVGYVRYFSINSPAKVFFAADSSMSSVDFRFTSSRGSFPYMVVFVPIIPAGNPSSITTINNRFLSTVTPESFASPIHGETQDRYILKGEVRIYVSAGLKNLPLPADSYSSKIYVFLVSD